MINQLLTHLRNIADAVTGVFLAPGEMLLSLFARIAPDTAATLSSGNGALIITVVLALCAWTLIAVLGMLLMRFFRNVLHQVRAVFLTVWYRSRLGFSGLLMRAKWKLRALFPRRNPQDDAFAASMVEFDDLDIAILSTVSAQGPGFALSAPDLAERFNKRPAQVQGSLDKLSSNRLLASVIGSTDGFDNYRATDSGTAFIAKLKREHARG